jgi:chemotaxis protein methyltransferase CheR
MSISSSEITITDENIKNLDAVLRNLNVDITSLKKSHLLRRIRVRMLRSGFTSFSDYFIFLKTNNDEKSQLQLAFSINVTKFFRNSDTFEFLKKDVIPNVINNSTSKMIKVWSAGCANGAEPYSLAILFENFKVRVNRVIITATDYNYELLAFAKKGIYSDDYFDETTPEILQKYFVKQDSKNYKVKSNIQSYIEFKKHNLVKDRVLAERAFDLIVCRNVLIYFNRELQPTLFEKFYSALKPKGYLVLGRTESMPLDLRKKFKMINTTHRVFQKIS